MVPHIHVTAASYRYLIVLECNPQLTYHNYIHCLLENSINNGGQKFHFGGILTETRHGTTLVVAFLYMTRNMECFHALPPIKMCACATSLFDAASVCLQFSSSSLVLFCKRWAIAREDKTTVSTFKFMCKHVMIWTELLEAPILSFTASPSKYIAISVALQAYLEVAQQLLN